MRTVIFNDEEIFAYHKIDKEGNRVAIVVDENGEEVNVVFDEHQQIDRLFDYLDWCELEYYHPKKDSQCH